MKGTLYNGAAESDSNRNLEEIRKSISRVARRYINMRKGISEVVSRSLSREYCEMAGIVDGQVLAISQRDLWKTCCRSVM